MKQGIVKNLSISIVIWSLLFLALGELVYVPALLAVIGVVAGYTSCLFIGHSSLRASLLTFIVPLVPLLLTPFLQDPSGLLFTYSYISVAVFSIGVLVRLIAIFVINTKKKTYNKSLNQTGANNAPPG